MPQNNAIFVRKEQDARKDLRLSGFSGLHHLRVCNQMMLAAVQDHKVVYRSLASSVKQQELQLPISASDSISSVHLSPDGCHSVISCSSGETFYMNLKNNVHTALKRIKDVITAVAWHPEMMKDNETGHILMGTSNGTIIETNIAGNGTISFVKEHVTGFGSEGTSPAITSLKIFNTGDDEKKGTRCILFVCQASKLTYMTATINFNPPKSGYMGTASLQTLVPLPETPQHIYSPFFTSKDVIGITMPVATVVPAEVNSSLVFYEQPGGESHPLRFVWTGADGIIIGSINLYAEKLRDVVRQDNCFEHRRVEGRMESPVGVTMTEYHALLAYSTRLAVVSLYTYNTVFEDVWPVDLGCALGICFDSVSEFHWLYTGTNILKYRPNDETRNVWKFFLDSGDFARALMVTRERIMIEPEAHELVLKKQADKFISEKNFNAAAITLSQSNDPFEVLVLKFLSKDEDRRSGLKTLLEKRLEKMEGPENRLKRDALVLWLLEVQLAEAAEARRDGRDQVAAEISTQIQHFLLKKNVYESVETNKDVVYRLILSHGDFDTQLFLALHRRDYEVMIHVYLLRLQYKSVLDILKEQASLDLYKKYAPILIDHIPMEVMGSLIGSERILPQSMLPTLYKCKEDERKAIPAIKYLEWATEKSKYGSRDLHLHNFLIFMYAKFRPKKVHAYLTSKGMDKANIPYDLEFAIRTCQQFNMKKSLVFLFCVSELFQEAVEMALEMDLNFAKEVAGMMEPSEEEVLMGMESKYPKEFRRRIWLEIAKHAVKRDGGTELCINLLKESGGVLSIQDIFPLFPDFTKISHFKDSLCNCLQDHSKTIMDIQQSLKEATEIAQEIRERADKLKNRVVIVKAGDVCAGCSRSVANRPFFPFACRHFFHRECLEKAMMPHLDLESERRLADLLDRERKVLMHLRLDEGSPSKAAANSEREARYEEIFNEISQILGAECPLCGSIAIELIDRPFFSEVEYAEDRDSWLIN